MAYGQEKQHVQRVVVDEDGESHVVLEAMYAPTSKRQAFEPWFVCPTDATTHLESEGVVVNGVRYSPRAGEDLLALKARERG